MRFVAKVFGWVSVALAAVSSLGVVLASFDGAPNARDAVLGFMLLTGFFGIPGGLLLALVRRREAADRRWAEALAFAQSHERFTVDELGRALGVPGAEAEALLLRVSSKEELSLVFGGGVYHRRGTAAAPSGDRVTCGQCGGTFEALGERPSEFCPNCGTPMAAAAATSRVKGSAGGRR